MKIYIQTWYTHNPDIYTFVNIKKVKKNKDNIYKV